MNTCASDEAQRFLAVLKEWPVRDVANMLLLAFFTGMRRGEMFKLEVGDLDFHMKLIRIRDPKGGKSVSIGLSNVAEEVIRAQLAWKDERFPGSPYVFPEKDGNLRKDCSAVDTIRQVANLPPGFRPFHGLRHHFAVTLANSGQFTPDMIAEMLTHKNAEFTKKKIRTVPARIHDGSGQRAGENSAGYEGLHSFATMQPCLDTV